MPRPVALLDVDHTLLFDTELNETLLQSLKSKGINDLYLFTDMRYGRLTVKDRLELVETLKAKGFAVHGVITPVDLVWQQFSAEDALTMEKWASTATFKGKFSGEEFEELINTSEIQEQLPFLIKVRTYSPENNVLGASYDESLRAYNSMPVHAKEDDPLPGEMLTRSSYAKVYADHLAERQGYSHTKGLLLDFFLHHKPEWVSSILIADDNDNVIKAISQYEDKNKPKLPITAIKVTGNNLEASFYEAAIDEHLQKDPIYTILNKIDAHIENLSKSKFNPFLSSPAAKIKALEILKTNLQKALVSGAEVNIKDVIVEWEGNVRFTDKYTNENVSIAKVLSQHRNIFRSEFRDKDTNTQSFIRGLKTEFGDISFNKVEEVDRNEIRAEL